MEPSLKIRAAFPALLQWWRRHGTHILSIPSCRAAGNTSLLSRAADARCRGWCGERGWVPRQAAGAEAAALTGPPPGPRPSLPRGNTAPDTAPSGDPGSHSSRVCVQPGTGNHNHEQGHAFFPFSFFLSFFSFYFVLLRQGLTR